MKLILANITAWLLVLIGNTEWVLKVVKVAQVFLPLLQATSVSLAIFLTLITIYKALKNEK